jgi:DNA-binding NarL/FixJ family response regulator
MKHPRIILADDHTLILEAFRKLLEPAYNVVGMVTDGFALLQAVVLNPDVAVIDIAMPRLNGLEAGRRLKCMKPIIKLIFLTMNEDPTLAAEAMHQGASGYLLKTSAASELFQAIQAALRGRSYVSPQIAKGIQEAFIREPQGKKRRKELTFRQREVIQLLAEGKTMKEAADILGLSPRTIAFHKYQMMQDLGIKTTAELIQMGIKKHVLVA